MIERVEEGSMVFVSEGREGIGAVRAIKDGQILVYVENAGEFAVSAAAIVRVHDGKVMLDAKKLDRKLLEAVGHAHDREDPSVAG
jgi:hypothetical protein